MIGSRFAARIGRWHGARRNQRPSRSFRAFTLEPLEHRRLLATIHGQKWDDLNADGHQDDIEPGIDRWDIQLLEWVGQAMPDWVGLLPDGSDGHLIASTETFSRDLNGDGQIDATTEQGLYEFSDLDEGIYLVREVPRDGWIQTSRSPLSTVASQLDAQFGFYTDSRLFENFQGSGERWLRASKQNDEWFYILPNGELYDWDESSGSQYRSPLNGTLVAQLNSIFYTDPVLLATAPDETTALVVLGPDDDRGEANFGNYRPGMLAGRKWRDLNADGLRDGTESFLNDWTIELLDAAGNVLQTALTRNRDIDGDGIIASGSEVGWYTFDNLPHGDFRVREILRDGWLQSWPITNEHSVTVVSGLSLDDLDFGNYLPTDVLPPGSIHGRKWHDLNLNGDHDSDEPFLNGWMIELVDSSGNVVEMATTSDKDVEGDGAIDPETETGWYWFDNVSAGTYTVREVTPGGWLQSWPLTNVHSVTVTDGELVQNINFGNYLASDVPKPGAIHGRKWHDQNADGDRDSNEPFLNGWMIELVDNSGNVVEMATTSNKDVDGDGAIDPETDTGWYGFDNVSVGTYTVREVTPAGWLQSWPLTNVHSVTVANGQLIQDISFGNYLASDGTNAIHGRKWHDLNADGDRDANEPFLNGWIIELVDSLRNVIRTATTSNKDVDGDGVTDPETETGWYWFDKLPAGAYTVREVMRRDWKQSHPDPSDAIAFELDQEIDFVRQSPLFEDTVGQGEKWFQSGKDDKDWYYITPNGDVFMLNNSLSISDGATLMARLSSRFHDDLNLLVDVAEPNVGTIDVGTDSVEEISYGNYLDGSIHGRVWNDANPNGTVDEGETYLNDWTIELINDSGQKVATTSTMDLDTSGQIGGTIESGWYWFNDVRPGPYTIRQVLPQGWTQTFPDGTGSKITLNSGEQLEGIDFGNHDLALSVRILEVALGRLGAVEQITIVFDRPITGFTLDAITLMRTNDEFSELSLSQATLRTTDNMVWVLGNLNQLTTPAGRYEVRVDHTRGMIIDQFGNSLSAGDVDRWIHGPGDATLDGLFNQIDLVQVLQIDKYLKNEPATWSEGDWNLDGVFNQFDVALVLQLNHYLGGPFAEMSLEIVSPTRFAGEAELSAIDQALTQEFL